jgi:FSR family fosmidomycin resistance protein-like MFS transporter
MNSDGLGSEAAHKTVFGILYAISFCHLLNDLVQSLIPSIYPILKASYGLSFSQLGLLTLTYQLTASLLQPFIGLYTDRRPQPYSLPAGVTFTFAGVILLAWASSFGVLLAAAACVGLGSASFHPESSRVARLASGGRHGLAQSVFQLGGTFGSAIGPLLAAFVVLPRGQHSLSWFSLAALLAIFVLTKVARWYKNHLSEKASRGRSNPADLRPILPPGKIAFSLAILIALIFSKYFYLAGLTSYYTFYLISKFHVSIASAQLHLFLFLGSAAVGLLIGGPVGDRIGRKYVIWASIVGVLPFTLALPYANLFWTSMLSIVIGLVISSAFSAILVYAQELLPGKIGMISGLFFGLAFGMGGIGAALLGALADRTSIEFVYSVCSYLPAIGLLTGFLPNIDGPGRWRTQRVDPAPVAETVSPAIPASSEFAGRPRYQARRPGSKLRRAFLSTTRLFSYARQAS